MFSSLTLPAPPVAAAPGAWRARTWARLSALWHAQRSPQAIVCVLAVWLLATANWALWGRLAQADGHTGSALLLCLRFAALVLPGTVLLMGLTAWPRGMKPVWVLLLVVAACAQHFMLSYGVVIDPVMVRNVLQQAGLAVLWLDNQAGCKGVCERVPHASTEDALATPAARRLCDGEECLDDLMLEGLDARIAALPAERRQRGVVGPVPCDLRCRCTNPGSYGHRACTRCSCLRVGR